MTFTFTTRIYVKDYDEGKIWCTSDYVDDFSTDAPSKKEAYQEYFNHLDSYGYSLSKTQRKNFRPYGESDGALLFGSTAKSLMADRSANYCREHYFDVFTKVFAYDRIDLTI